MARKKRTSKVLETSHQRMAGLSAIDPPVDLGSNLSLTIYSAKINAFRTKLDKYNQMLASLDELQNEIDDDENDLRDANKRMLSAVEAHYGSNSSEYEQAGGTPTRDRKRPVRKAPAKPAS